MDENYFEEWLKSCEYKKVSFDGKESLIRKDNEFLLAGKHGLDIAQIFNLGVKYGISIEKRRTFDDGK